MIQNEDADTFFEKVKEDVTAIDEFSKPHPLSADVAVTKLKRYMPEPRHRIRLSDLDRRDGAGDQKATGGDAFRADKPEPTPQFIAKRVQAYDGACSTLTAMAAVAGGWAESEHYWMWQRALKQLSGTRPTTGVRNYTVWRELQRYPATRLLYALGLGAVRQTAPGVSSQPAPGEGKHRTARRDGRCLDSRPVRGASRGGRRTVGSRRSKRASDTTEWMASGLATTRDRARVS